MNTKDSIISYLSAGPARHLIKVEPNLFKQVSEIRMRAERPMLLKARGREYEVGEGFRPTQIDITETMERISQYSYYAFEEEMAAGYITLPGGHRVGITGQAVLDGSNVRTLRNINGINIRIANSVYGCADSVLHKIRGGGKPFHTMVVSPPGCGKTTMLRDIVRQLSDGGLTVGLVDERSEVAGCFKGVPQNDVGSRTDVLDGCPKAAGMVMLLRAMAPDVIAVDELGGERDARAVEDVLNAGVKLICTTHGHCAADVRKSPSLGRLFERGVFERFVVLESVGKVSGVYGPNGADAV